MWKYKFSATKKVLLIAFCAIFMSCLMIGYSFFNGSARAATTSTTAVSALYDFNKYCYDQTSLDALAEKILGNGKKIDDLIQYAKDAGTNGTAITNRELTVEYGRYRSSTASSYKPLVWIPVYLSRASGGDAVLTLYLAETAAANGSTSAQEIYQFSHSGTYSYATSGCNAPTNSYGTSHMRSVTLGNLEQYATYTTDHSALLNLIEPSEPKSTKVFKFSDFITTVDGVAGLLTDDLLTPSDIAWQASESAMTSIDAQGVYYDTSSGSNLPINTYSWPNEAYGTPSSINYYQPGYFDYSAGDTDNAKDKYNYNVWKNDKVWLPSLSEVGTGDLDGNNQGYLDGIWKLDAAQRGNSIKSWLRTACTSVSRSGNSYSTYTMFATDTNGNITTADVGERCGIRPAIHLDLTRIARKTVAPINLPEEIVTTYNGEAQVISSFGTTTVDPSQLEGWWQNDGSMLVSFYVYEKDDQTEFNIPIAPIESGTYYMVVELLNSSNNFFGEPSTTRWKATKFTIKKIQLDVVWEYDAANYNQPTSVKFADESQILDRDIRSGLIPHLGMKYSYYNGSGLHDSLEFPDLKGEYYATAYIKNDNLYNYNYEISDSTKTSQIFTVKEKNLELPYFLEAGEGAYELQLSYRGAQYVQIANATKYVQIKLQSVSGSTDTAALSKVEDLGVINDIHTFKVESCGSYIFVATVLDTTNTQWKTSTENNKDVEDRTLELVVTRAEVTVAFDGLPSSWDTNKTVSFSLTVLGVYEATDVNFVVRHQRENNPTQTPVNKNPSTGKYEIPAGLAVGTYNITAVISGQIGSNYILANNATWILQKFTVYQAVAEFGSSRANWQYVLGDATSAVTAGEYNTHNTPEKALELENTGDYYKFSMVWSETRFTQENLQAKYTGDIRVKDAGLYSVTVVISAYNSNISFTDETYTIYFRIKKKLLDLTQLEWDYSGTPFTYSGNANSVGITAASLAKVPGLTVDSYTTNGNGIDASSYVTAVKFLVSDSNYEVPVAGDSTTYKGTFSFTCEWEVAPQKIIVVWTTDNSSSNLAYIPRLKVGSGYVNYSFEHKVGNDWVPCTTLSAETVTETYRVSATLKSAYATNYELVDNVPQEFEVESGKEPVILSFEMNGKPCDSDEQFTYTGSPFVVTPVLSSDTVKIKEFTVEYFTAVAGVRGTSLGTNAPTNVGSYAAVVTVVFDGGYLAAGSGNEVFFEITKADLDISNLRWTYTHTTLVGSVTVVTAINAYFDTAQGKWIDVNTGEEVDFSFEYDNTEHKLVLDGESLYSGKINISDIQGNTGTTAGNYAVQVSYTWSDNYNDPEFPRTLNWTITKANLNFDEVKWGYFDEEGNEYEFESGKDWFTYTRVADSDDSREYNYTVGLINLPDYLKNSIRYFTTSQTVVDASEVEGNSFSAIDTYLTRFTFAGYAGDANHNAVVSFPSTISSYMFWEIRERELTQPFYNGDWTEFDDKPHDLIELCNIPEEELFYFHIDIIFMDTEHNITKNYDGSNYFGNDPEGENFGGKFFGFHAGTYSIYFSRIMDIDGVETDIFFARIDIEVEKQLLYVVWDTNGSVPVARVKGVYISDIIETVYTNENGGPVELDYIKTTDGITFYALAQVSSKYSKDLQIQMEEGESEKVKFTTYLFTPGPSSAQLDKPEFENDKLEFTGNTLTFYIAQWFLQYEQYLYISDGVSYDSERGVAYAVEQGDYYITISFKKDADAYWRGTSGNRDPFTMKFTVTKPTRVALEYPVLNQYSVDYTEKPIEFKITNWLVIGDYLDYEVSYAGTSLGRNIPLNFITAGIYTITFMCKTQGEVTGYWEKTSDTRDYVIQIEIVDPNNRSTTILNPTIDRESAEYTGEEIIFTVNNWDSYYSRYIELICSSPNVTISGGEIKAVNVGSYTIVARIKSGVSMTFADLSTEYSFSISITPADGEVMPLEKPSFVISEQTYTGGTLEFRISEWDSIYSKYLDISCSNANVEIVGGVIRVTAIGNYTLTVRFKEGALATWIGGSTQEISLPFSVKAAPLTPGEPEKLENPVLNFTTREYTGRDIVFVIENWNSLKQYVTILEGENHLTQVEVNVYTVTLKIKDTSKAVWAGAEGDTFVLTFTIKKANITITVGDDGKPVAKNSDGEIVDIDKFFDVTYYDPDTGEEVKNPEEGKEYEVKYTVKNEEEFNKCIENYEEVKNIMTTNTFIYKYEAPKKGLGLVVIIAIASVAFVIFLFIVLIIVIAIKRRNAYYADDYYEEYEDYEDDDDYYDEY